jgi:tetratricopeptide (TPR) repeat protein
VLAIINSRPFSFDSSFQFQQDQQKAEPVLKQAVDVARRYEKEAPRDLVDSLCNLGSFYFIANQYSAADQLLTEAVEVADKHTVRESLAMAALLDNAGMGARAVHDYKRAYTLYLRALKIRRTFQDDRHPDISYSLMNLASLCRDRALDEGEKWQKEAEALERQIDYLTHHTEFLSADLSNHQPRPFVPDLAINKGTSMLPSMVAFAQSIIEKHRQIIRPHFNPGLASVVGNWSVPTDLVIKAIVDNGESRELTPEGEERRSGKSEQESRVAGVEIFLCDASQYSTLWSVIAAFGRERGAAMEKLGETWPATHKQGQDLLLRLQRTAAGISVSHQQTDKNGDFEFMDVPAGTYFTFAVLTTQEQCRIWFLPDMQQLIRVKRVQQFTVNFTPDNAVVVWNASGSRSKAGLAPRASRTVSVQPPPYFAQPPQP